MFAAKDFSLLPAHRWRLGRHHAFLSADMALTADSNNRSKMSLDYRWSQSLGVAVAADWLGEGSVYAAMKSADNLVNAMLAST